VGEEAQLVIDPQHILGRRIHPLTVRQLVYAAASTAGIWPPVAAFDPALTEVRWVTLDELDRLLPDIFPRHGDGSPNVSADERAAVGAVSRWTGRVAT
jgi:hypothetical protein